MYFVFCGLTLPVQFELVVPRLPGEDREVDVSKTEVRNSSHVCFPSLRERSRFVLMPICVAVTSQ